MRTTSFRLIPVLIFFCYLPLALAMGNNSTESKTPDCPSGQVYDSATQKCVPDKSSSLSDQDKTNYAYHLAKKGEYQAALNLLDSLKMATRLKRGTIAGSPRANWAERTKGLVITSVRWLSPRITPKPGSISVKRGW